MGRIQKVQKIYSLRNISIFRAFVVPLLLGVWLSSCTTYHRVIVDTKKVAATLAETEIPESDLLDVRIQIFDPGKLPTSKDALLGLSEEIRTAESHYTAVQLKNTLQQTGYWGAVRVVPADSSGDEVLVNGRILKSNGEVLKLQIRASDATGKKWFKKTFKGAVDVKMYTDSSNNQLDVFQNVYNKISNELAKYRQTMTSEEIQEIRHVAEMRFAEELAPGAFSGYLKKEKKGRVSLDRLPSENDEMLARIRRVRERDYLLIDTLDSHYDGLHRKMGETYTDWRRSRLVEMNMIRLVDDKKNQQRAAGVLLILLGAAAGAAASNSGGYNPALGGVVGAAAGAGAAAFINAGQISQEAEINRAALEELGISFGAEVKPIVLEVEGETVQLTGSAEAKYQQWREVLGRLYQLETETEKDPVESNPGGQEPEKPITRKQSYPVY